MEEQLRRLLARQDAMEADLERLRIELRHEKLRSRLYREKYEVYMGLVDALLREPMQVSPHASVQALIRSARKPVTNLDQEWMDHCLPQLGILFGGRLRPFPYNRPYVDADLVVVCGMKPCYQATRLLVHARQYGIPCLLMEDGLISSVAPHEAREFPPAYRRPFAATLGEGAVYFNSGYPTSVENVLNSGKEFNNDELARAKKMIRLIVERRLSKYNHQESGELPKGRHPRVLVVDQVWGDQSIYYGRATDGTFREMLDAAILENPGADIYIKTHPMGGGHFRDLERSGRIRRIDGPMNPIVLLEQVDKVYVCTSTMGFEALMCGKETHVFGMPFYAGWGITRDRLACPRRCRKRTLEEIFYAVSLLHTVYVSYRRREACEMEEAVEELLELREDFRKKFGRA